MHHFLSILILFICSLSMSSQVIEKYDTIINTGYYLSFYSKEIKGPSFVMYKLYKGGGDISRSGMTFKSWKKLPHFNYAKSGYDKGHLVSAEDYAYDKNKLKSTFYYINCVPQTSKLNRGQWKRYENLVRRLSQQDSLLIVCGGCDYDKKTLIPKNCFKIVYNLRNHQWLYSHMFTNDNVCIVTVNDSLRTHMSLWKMLKIYNERIKNF